MKSNYILIIASFLILSPIGKVSAQLADIPRKDIELAITSQSGNNGISVSWNEEKRIYYAVYGGSATYPLEIFSEDGKSIFSKEIGYDIRGMAYHEKWNCLVGNLYDDGGYYKIYLDESGIPDGRTEIVVSGRHQPTSQSGGTFNTRKNVMYTIYDSNIYSYSIEDGLELEEIQLSGLSQKDLESCVSGMVLYTGHRGYEFMLVNYQNYQMYFFNERGKFVKTLSFEPASYISAKYNLAFCNNRLWSYNKNSRKWTSYLIFF